MAFQYPYDEEGQYRGLKRGGVRQNEEPIRYGAREVFQKAGRGLSGAASRFWTGEDNIPQLNKARTRSPAEMAIAEKLDAYLESGGGENLAQAPRASQAIDSMRSDPQNVNPRNQQFNQRGLEVFEQKLASEQQSGSTPALKALQEKYIAPNTGVDFNGAGTISTSGAGRDEADTAQFYRDELEESARAAGRVKIDLPGGGTMFAPREEQNGVGASDIRERLGNLGDAEAEQRERAPAQGRFLESARGSLPMGDAEFAGQTNADRSYARLDKQRKTELARGGVTGKAAYNKFLRDEVNEKRGGISGASARKSLADYRANIARADIKDARQEVRAQAAFEKQMDRESEKQIAMINRGAKIATAADATFQKRAKQDRLSREDKRKYISTKDELLKNLGDLDMNFAKGDDPISMASRMNNLLNDESTLNRFNVSMARNVLDQSSTKLEPEDHMLKWLLEEDQFANRKR